MLITCKFLIEPIEQSVKIAKQDFSLKVNFCFEKVG